MSQENVEIVRASIDAFNRGDVDAAFKDVIPEFEYDQTRAVGLDRGMFNLEQFRSLLATFTDSWESFTIGADELIDAGGDVVMPFTNVARGRDGIEVQARGIWVWTLRGGSIVRACLYQDRQEALEAAGLSEQAMSQEDIKILRAFNEAFNRRDFDDATKYLDRAVEIYPGVMAPDHDSKLFGHEGWREFIRVAIQAWETATAEPLERIETEDGRILLSICGAFEVGKASKS